MKWIRLVLFFIISILAFGLLNWGLLLFLDWLLEVKWIWLLLVSIILTYFHTLQQNVCLNLSFRLVNYIHPIKYIGPFTIQILAVLNALHLGYNAWVIKNDYSGWDIYGAIFFSLLLINITGPIVAGGRSGDYRKNPWDS